MVFNIYYINLSKVYELAMMINNVIVSTISKESSLSLEQSYEEDSKLSAGYLDSIKATIGANRKVANTKSEKLVETLEVKTTKSLMLKKVISKCKDVTDFSGLQEGDLILLKDVQLELDNEMELRQVKFVANGALKGFVVEGVDISNITNSMFKDYSYLLKGQSGNEDFMIKIPLQFEGEFENLYNVDDLLIGNVAIVGVYKNRVVKKEIKNTFSFMMENGSESNDSLIKKSTSNEKEKAECQDKQTYNFIDVLSIIQLLNDDELQNDTKVVWYKRLNYWIRKKLTLRKYGVK